MKKIAKRQMQETVQLDANRPPPYHVFEWLGECFVYDTSSCQFLRIDSPTLQFLELCLTHSIKESENLLIAGREWTESIVKSVAKEVNALAEQGLFDRPEYSANCNIRSDS